ncbi:CDP-glycerol glycerophosphotransferase family protein [Bacillus cytotoxicus]|nr:CDP-glycerol glycerophosphotransferase family protein [Bacillus cytotoxicus]
MNKDKITIIVPMYNVEEYIEQTIQSLLNQTHPNIEIILVDDVSTDQTFSIASYYANKDERIRLIKQGENCGVAHARNTGLQLATGSYITFVDADDLLHVKALETMYTIASKQKADLVIGAYEIFKTISSNLIQKELDSPITRQLFIDANPEIFSNVYSWGKLYKKKVFEGTFFPTDLPLAEDQPFSVDIYLKAKKICITSSIVYFYRNRDSENVSLTQSAFTTPIVYLQYYFRAFEKVKHLFEKSEYGLKNPGFTIYVRRVIEESIHYIFIGNLTKNTPAMQQQIITLLTNWIQTLDADLILKTGSFQNVFVAPVEKYIKHMNPELLQHYIKLLTVIKEKILTASQQKQKINPVEEQNSILNTFLEEIDNFLIKHNIVASKDYFVCYPKVHSLDINNNVAIVQFQLIQGTNTSEYEICLSKKNKYWAISNIQFQQNIFKKNIIIKNKKPKILLTYRNFSGCNTLALYKSIPDYIKEHFKIELVSGNKFTNEYFQKIVDSDIVVTTNMEYRFNKQRFNPNQIVIDLWHGFPLKTMFYTDHNYHDKNSVASIFSQLNYLTSYSPLYNEALYKCIRVNPNNFVITGAPRNDLLFNKNSRELLFKLLNKNDINQKFIFYMPTFRSKTQPNHTDYSSNLFGFNKFNLHSFNHFLKLHNFELIVKPHPIFGESYHDMLKELSNISVFPTERLEKEQTDLYEVLSATTLLITDYSSTYFDYLLLDKPIIFTPTDVEEYYEDRGFLLSAYEDWTPGPKVFNQQDLQNEIISYNTNTIYYQEIRKQISQKIHTYQDANSSKRTWEFIANLHFKK